jgi:hypothetical protein
MLLLPDEVRIARGASPESAVDQQALKIDERCHRDPRRTDHHAGTDDRVQHPFRQHCDDAGRRLDEDETAVGA